MTGLHIRSDERGASSVEYVAMISLVALGAWAALGESVSEQVTCAASAIANGRGGCAALHDRADGADGDGAAAAAAASTYALTAEGSPAGAGESGSEVALASGSGTDDEPTDVGPPPSDPPREESPLEAAFNFYHGVVGGLLEGTGEFVNAVVDVGSQAVDSAAVIIAHPAETLQVLSNGASDALAAVGTSVAHPRETLDVLWDTVTHLDRALSPVIDGGAAIVGSVIDWAQDFVDTMLHSPWEQKGWTLGRAVFDAALVIVPVGRVSRLVEMSRVMKTAEAVELLPWGYGSRFVGTIDEAMAALRGSQRGGIALRVVSREPRPILATRLGDAGTVELTTQTFARADLPASAFSRADLASVTIASRSEQLRTAQRAFEALEPGGEIRLGVAFDAPVRELKRTLEIAGFRGVVTEFSGAYRHWVVTAIKP